MSLSSYKTEYAIRTDSENNRTGEWVKSQAKEDTDDEDTCKEIHSMNLHLF